MSSSDSAETRPHILIEAELNQLREVYAAFAQLEAPDFATEVSMLSAETRLSELLAEEAAVLRTEAGDDAELVLDGEAVADKAIRVDFLAAFLGHLQHLVDAVAEGRTGHSTARGQVKGDVRESVQMAVTGFAGGSFAVRLSVPNQPEPLFGTDTIGTVLSLFRPDPETGEFLAFLRLPRVRSNYEELMKVLVRHRSSFALSYRQSPASVAFTPTMARDRLEWMDLLDVSEQPMLVHGELLGGNVERHTYELLVDEAHYRGRVLESALGGLRRVRLGSAVAAKLLVVTKSHEDGILESRTDYYLESVNPVDDEQQAFGGLSESPSEE